MGVWVQLWHGQQHAEAWGVIQPRCAGELGQWVVSSDIITQLLQGAQVTPASRLVCRGALPRHPKAANACARSNGCSARALCTHSLASGSCAVAGLGCALARLHLHSGCALSISLDGDRHVAAASGRGCVGGAAETHEGKGGCGRD